MATKRQLRSRWEDAKGQQQASAVMVALRKGATVQELGRIVSDMPFADEVKPSIDLRGLRFQELLCLQNIDLSHSRLDYAILGGHLTNCRLVDAVLDGVEAVNLSLQSDFTRASFIRANLKGTSFLNAVLAETNFTKANLYSARLKNAMCQGAVFVEAHMKFAHCAGADFREADLSSADLSGASLGSISFDSGTLLQGTILTGAAMSPDFRRFAQQAGAAFPKDAESLQLAVFDAALALLKRRNVDGGLDAVLEQMASLRTRIVENPTFDWGTDLARKFSPGVVEEITEVVQEASLNLVHYV
jgi:uncharacterized protein YjbI with pentapeptide repeats